MKRKVRMEDLMPIFIEQLENDKKVKFTPSGVSMRPMLHDKTDHVYLERAFKENIKKWDIILYQNDVGEYMMHRVINLDEDGFVTRGDNCYRNDKKQPYSVLIGKVYKFERSGKSYSVDSFLYKAYVLGWLISYIPRKVLNKIIK